MVDKIDKISIFLEIEGKPYVALLNDKDPTMIVNVLGSIFENGVLRVTSLPSSFSFETFDLKGGKP